MSIQEMRLSESELTALTIAALEAADVSRADATACAEILVTADMQGITTHGVRRLVPYISRIRQGLISASPEIAVDHGSQTVVVVDGGNGLGPVVARRALDEALDIATKTGLAFVGCRASNHFGAGAPYALLACRRQMVMIAGTNAFRTMAPWGGTGVRLGNNPLAFGAPCGEEWHFILDIAMSVGARGKIRAAQEQGEQIPPGWALDATGHPTTDPLAALKGFVMPIGGHKGYGLALMIDILSGVLTGALFGSEARSLFQDHEAPQGLGHFFLVIDPARFMPLSEFQARMRQLAWDMESAPASDPNSPVVLPGAYEHAKMRAHAEFGVPVPTALVRQLEALGRGEEVAVAAVY